MAFDVTALTNYVDEQSTDLLLPAVTEGRTAGLVSMQTGIKSARALQLFDTDVVFQADDCSYNANGSTSFSQRTLTVGDIKIQETLCPKNLEPKWTQLLLSPGCNYDESDIPAAFMSQKMARITDALEIADWQGDTVSGTGNNAFYDGFIKIIDDAGTAIDGNTGSTGAPDETNALAIAKGMYTAVPVSILDKDDLTGFCGYDFFRALICNITNDNLFHYNTDAAAEAGRITIPGTNLTFVAVNGLTGTDRLYVARTSNMFIGHDLESDSEEVMMWLADDKKNVRSSICFKRGTQVAYPDEIVEYTAAP